MNRFLSRTAFIFMCSFFPYFNYAMELQSVEEQKPTIKCNLYIDYDPYQICYASEEYHALGRANSSIMFSIAVPLISVKASFSNEQGEMKCWDKDNIPQQIKTFETKRYKQQCGSDQLSQEETIELTKRIEIMVPDHYLPITLLLGKKTNSIIHCNAYGYPTQLCCCSSGEISFEQRYSDAIETCTKLHILAFSYDFLDRSRELLKKEEIMKSDDSGYYSHGKNSYFYFIRSYLTHKEKFDHIILLLLLVQSLEQTE